MARARGIVAGWRSIAHPQSGGFVQPIAGPAKGASR